MSHEGGSRGWPKVQELVHRVEPRLIDLFRSHDIPPEPAGKLLGEVVTLLLYRWGEIVNPEAWLFEVLEYRLRRDHADGGDPPLPPDPLA